jgi:PEP-CTERM motif
MRKYIVQGACVLAFLTGFSLQGRAQVNLVSDGNFAQLFGGGWSGTAGFVTPFHGDADGNGNYVHLLANEPPLYQTLSTIAGMNYQLIFASRIPQPAEFTGDVGPNGQPQGPWSVEVDLAPFSSAGNFTDNSDTVWSFFTLNFTANSTATYLGFKASGRGDPEIDAISVYPTPEPATLGLLAAGGTALLLRRRRREPRMKDERVGKRVCE